VTDSLLWGEDPTRKLDRPTGEVAADWVRLEVSVNPVLQRGARTFLSAQVRLSNAGGQECPRSCPRLLTAPPPIWQIDSSPARAMLAAVSVDYQQCAGWRREGHFRLVQF
jgi:hypothetical protein